jgi:hypothetical protein
MAAISLWVIPDAQTVRPESLWVPAGRLQKTLCSATVWALCQSASAALFRENNLNQMFIAPAVW